MYSFKKSVTIIFIFILFASFFLTRLNVSNTPGTYIPPELESKQLNERILKEFNNDDTLMFLFEINKEEYPIFLKKLYGFVKAIEGIENIVDVHSVFSYEAIRGVDGGFETIKIINGDELENFNFDKTKKLVATDKFVKDLFVNKDLNIFGVLIEPREITDSFLRLELEKKILLLLEKFDLKNNELAYGGEFSVDTAQYKELNHMMAIVVPITFILGCLLLYLLFQSKTAVIVGSVFNGLIAYVIFSLFGLFGWPYNMIAAMIPTLMMALTIAFIVHLYNSILLRIESGKNIKEAVETSVDKVKKPSFYSAITTAAGLFSLCVSQIPPIRSVGAIGGIGVMAIYYFVLYLLPPVIIRFDPGVWKQNFVIRNILDKIVVKIVDLSIRSPKTLITAFVFIMAVLSIFIFRVESESNLRKFFHPNHSVNVSSEIIKKEFVGSTIVNILFTNNDQTVLTTEFNQKIDRLKQRLLEVEHLSRVFSTTDMIKQMHWAFNDENESFYVVPDSDELIEQYLLIYDGEDIFDFLSNDNKRFKMTLNLDVEGANEIEKVLKKIEQILAEEGFNSSSYGMAGYGKMFSDQENLIMNDLLKSVSMSIGVIFIIMLLLWRSFSSSLFCMVPNISPVLGMFIAMGVFGIWLDIGTAMIASVTVGIAVDDTIHVFQGFLTNFNEKKMELKEALLETYNESGRAIIITTLILASQFAILMMTNFYPLRNFGLLTSVGITVALIFDLLLLPALISLHYHKKY